MPKPILSQEIREKLLKGPRENGMRPLSTPIPNPDIEPGTYRSSPWQTTGNGNGNGTSNGRKAAR